MIKTKDSRVLYWNRTLISGIKTNKLKTRLCGTLQSVDKVVEWLVEKSPQHMCVTKWLRRTGAIVTRSLPAVNGKRRLCLCSRLPAQPCPWGYWNQEYFGRGIPERHHVRWPSMCSRGLPVLFHRTRTSHWCGRCFV